MYKIEVNKLNMPSFSKKKIQSNENNTGYLYEQ